MNAPKADPPHNKSAPRGTLLWLWDNNQRLIKNRISPVYAHRQHDCRLPHSLTNY